MKIIVNWVKFIVEKFLVVTIGYEIKTIFNHWLMFIASLLTMQINIKSFHVKINGLKISWNMAIVPVINNLLIVLLTHI